MASRSFEARAMFSSFLDPIFLSNTGYNCFLYIVVRLFFGSLVYIPERTIWNKLENLYLFGPK